jgi:peptidoglycan-N-acetylglucosamine deacetylase
MAALFKTYSGKLLAKVAGLCGVIVLLFSSQIAFAEKRIALTFDDVPRMEGAFLTRDDRRAKLIAALKQAKVKQAAFFVNPGHLSDLNDPIEANKVMDYVRAGHMIANHTMTHGNLSEMTAEAYLADIDKTERWLKGRKGYRPWFRFTFLNEGRSDKVKRDAIRTGLRARGLSNGYVTAEASDWHIENLTIESKQKRRFMDRDGLRDLYVQRHVEAANFYNDLAVKALGRSPAHVMLLHETDIAALYIQDLVAALRADGWKIITADKAYADPIARAMPDTPSAQGGLIEALAWEKNLPEPRWYKYNDTELLTKEFHRKVYTMNVIISEPKK